MRCQILVTDLDGTLLNRRGEVSPRNLEAIDRARQAGIEVVFATGRSWIECRSVAKSALGSGMTITAGGAALHEVATGTCQDRIVIPHDLVAHCTQSLVHQGHLAHLLKDATRAGYDYLLVGDAQLDEASRWWFSVHPLQTRAVAALAHDAALRSEQLDDVLRVGTVAVASELARVAATIRADVPERLTVKHWPALVALGQAGVDTHLLEIFDADVDKWKMIERLCASRDVDPREVVTIGDGLNDIGMLQGCERSYAVANAQDDVAHFAKRRAPDHDNDAFAFVVEDILNGQ